jgi:glutamate-1-semialdehyde 2,1-aminomutase
VTLGKVIGGGLPIGAYGGRADAMAMVAPEGPVYQAGTLSGSPLAMAAGAATLDALRPPVYRHLERTARRLETILREAADGAGETRFHLPRVGSMLGVFFGAATPADTASALAVDRERFRRFFAAALDGGVHLPPSALETSFVSTAMRPADLDRAAGAFRRAFAAAAGASGFADA